MLFISPPFGNYIDTKNTISIKGSYTLYPRPGKILQIIKTLRYSQELNGWTNCIGLRNPGIDYAIKDWLKQLNDVSNNNINKTIYSIAILNDNEIPELLRKIPVKMNIELNVSCPNVKNELIVTGIEQFLNPSRKWCIIKISPTEDLNRIDQYYKKGFRQFHCSNTLKVQQGGLSGPMLKPYTNDLIRHIRKTYPDTTIIAGGGIQTANDISNYRLEGANHFSISSVFFNPFKALKLFWDLN